VQEDGGDIRCRRLMKKLVGGRQVGGLVWDVRPVPLL
jgi:hypothetical protein